MFLCPFCGSSNIGICPQNGGNGSQAICQKCYAKGPAPMGATPQQAEAGWNRRADCDPETNGSIPLTNEQAELFQQGKMTSEIYNQIREDYENRKPEPGTKVLVKLFEEDEWSTGRISKNGEWQIWSAPDMDWLDWPDEMFKWTKTPKDSLTS